MRLQVYVIEDRPGEVDVERGGPWVAGAGARVVYEGTRQREFRADTAGAQLAGRQNMIAALQRLQAEQDVPKDMPGELTAFGISGDMKNTFSRLFMTHPPLEERIAALKQAS